MNTIVTESPAARVGEGIPRHWLAVAGLFFTPKRVVARPLCMPPGGQELGFLSRVHWTLRRQVAERFLAPVQAGEIEQHWVVEAVLFDLGDDEVSEAIRGAWDAGGVVYRLDGGEVIQDPETVDLARWALWWGKPESYIPEAVFNADGSVAWSATLDNLERAGKLYARSRSRRSWVPAGLAARGRYYLTMLGDGEVLR